MDPGLMALGALATGATLLLRSFSKTRKEGFDVVPTAGYSEVARQGQEMYNEFTLSSDPRREAVRLAAMSEAEQAAYKQSMDAALSVPENAPAGDGTTRVERGETDTPVYVPDRNALMVRAAYCENKQINESVFNDQQFARDCGVCLTSGTRNDGSQFRGLRGLYIDEQSKRDLITQRDATGAKYTLSRPTLGNCDGATGGAGHQYSFAINKDELSVFMKRKDCQDKKSLDGSCATCLQDGSFTFVGKDNLPYDAVTFYVAGTGTLSASVGGKVIEFGAPTKDAQGKDIKVTTLALSERPFAFKSIAVEDALLNFTVTAPNQETPAELYGVLEVPNTTGGVIQISLDKILLNDDAMGGKPRRGRRFPTVTTPNGTSTTPMMISGFSKLSMVLSGNIPFLAVNEFPFEGIDCKGSLLQQKPSSVERFGADPCYKPSTQGPGSWTDACLKDRILSYGCVEGGDLFKNPNELRGMSMDDMRKTLQKISENQFSENTASKKCNGRDISTPCDPYINFNVNETPDISPQCIKFLYDNAGADIPMIGPTYTGPVNTYYSLDSNGKKIHCLPSGRNNPDTNPALVRQLQRESRSGAGTGRIGIPYVKEFFNRSYQRATNIGLNANTPDSAGGRGDSIAACYANLSNVTVFDSGVQANKNMVTGRFVRISYPAGRVDCLQVSQVVAIDSRGVNVAQGRPTSSGASYPWGGNNPASAVDGQLRPRGYPSIYHSACRAGDFWMVDLGQDYPLRELQYYNRSDCCGNRSSGMILEVLDANRNVVWSRPLTGQQIETFNLNAKVFNI